MAKLKADVVTADVLERYLRTSDDFAFEIAILHELQKRPALKLAHAGTYSDPITSKNRQFDFRVEFSPLQYLRIAVAIECKNLRSNYPLMISRLPRLEAESFHELLVPGDASDSEVFSAADRMFNASKNLKIESPHTPYALGDLVGKATTQVGQTPQGSFTQTIQKSTKSGLKQ